MKDEEKVASTLKARPGPQSMVLFSHSVYVVLNTAGGFRIVGNPELATTF